MKLIQKVYNLLRVSFFHFGLGVSHYIAPKGFPGKSKSLLVFSLLAVEIIRILRKILEKCVL